MKAINNQLFRTAKHSLCIALFGAALVYGQDSSGGWKRVGDAPPADTTTASNADQPVTANNGYPPIQQPNDPNQAEPVQPPPPGYNQGAYGGQAPAPNANPNYQLQGYQPPAPQPVPAQLTIPAGTYLTVRVNELLSSDKNHVGDGFSATLESPVVVNGVVTAEPGQTVGGRVAEAKQAGRIEGVARLGIQLTNLPLVDGQQIPINTQLVSRSGPTSVGQDAGTIMGTTALGAAAGAIADWGRGAAIGAGAGAAVGIIGVLVTRGHPSIITPEQVLTFRLNAPVTISTANSPQAFRYIQPGEYDRPYNSGPGPGYGGAGYGGPGYGGPGYGAQYYAAAPAPPYYYGYPYYYAGYPYYGWPGFAFYWGPGFYYGHYYYGHPYYGHYWGAYHGPVVAHAGVGGVAHVGGGAVGHASGGGGHR